MTTRLLLILATLLASCSGPTASPAPEAELPLFDAHLHYSEITWPALTSERALEVLRASGVRRALLSSTPDDGTLRLFGRAPDVIVPILRPYRTADDVARWTADESLIPYVEGRLAKGIYRGIGEIHLSAEQTRSPVVRRIVALSVEPRPRAPRPRRRPRHRGVAPRGAAPPRPLGARRDVRDAGARAAAPRV